MNSLKILSIYDRLFLRKAKFMFKVYNEITPTYISKNFALHNNVNDTVVRRSITSGCFVSERKYSGCLIWNSLPDEVKGAKTLETFHNRCLKWLVTG